MSRWCRQGEVLRYADFRDPFTVEAAVRADAGVVLIRVSARDQLSMTQEVELPPLSTEAAAKDHVLALIRGMLDELAKQTAPSADILGFEFGRRGGSFPARRKRGPATEGTVLDSTDVPIRRALPQHRPAEAPPVPPAPSLPHGDVPHGTPPSEPTDDGSEPF